MAKFITAQEAAALIKDGDTIATDGVNLSGFPDEVFHAIADRYAEYGHPAKLKLRQGGALGDFKERGPDRLCAEGLLESWSTGIILSCPKLSKLVLEEKLQCHCLPLGPIYALWREIAAGRPGVLSKVGLGTFVDPRLGEGKMNKTTTETLIELVEFQGEEYLLYKSFPVDVALIRGTTADEDGNITLDEEAYRSAALDIAEATRSSGGIVIVQVKNIAQRKTLDAQEVKIPGIMVDYVVKATDMNAHYQTESAFYDPSFAGHMRRPLSSIPTIPLSPDKVIVRRAACELRKGFVINCGVGIPALISSVVNEEGYLNDILMSAETGPVGGAPVPLPDFGLAYNADALMTISDMLQFIDGGGLDLTALGMAEADEETCLNVSKVGPKLVGPGGYIDISHRTKKVLFCGSFTAGSKIEIKDGRVHILKEGAQKKFVKKVQQITYNGKYGCPGQEVLYITERCVFRLIDGKITLVEVAPGIDFERDILANMDFTPEIAKDVKIMDPALFQETWGKLGEYISR